MKEDNYLYVYSSFTVIRLRNMFFFIPFAMPILLKYHVDLILIYHLINDAI